MSTFIDCLIEEGLIGTVRVNFEACIGREPSSRELAKIFNRLDFETYYDSLEQFNDRVFDICHSVAEEAEDF